MRKHAQVLRLLDSPGTTFPTAPRAAARVIATRAVHADEDRIAVALVDTVIRDLYLVGLRLTSDSQRDGEPLPPGVFTALEGIDAVIRSIRSVVFDLEH